MIIWIMATYLPSDICLLGVGGGNAGAGCVECFGFAMCIYHSGVSYCTLVSLLFTLGFFRILLWWSRYWLWVVNLPQCWGFTFVSIIVLIVCVIIY